MKPTKAKPKTPAARKPAPLVKPSAGVVESKPERVAELSKSEHHLNAVAMAKLALDPALTAIALVRDFNKTVGDLDPAAIASPLYEMLARVKAGNLEDVEAMLICQAKALEAIFGHLAGRAARNLGQNPGQVEQYLRLALKAQSQSRTTLETLANVKNPPVVYARQANIASGAPMQVNNGTPPAPALKQASSPNEILEGAHG